MEKSLQEIFEGILKDLGLSDDEIKVITTLIPYPDEMAQLVDYIEACNYEVAPQDLIEKATDIMMQA